MCQSKDSRCAIGNLQLENGEFTKTEKETLEELLVHFPGSQIIQEPLGGWDSFGLEFPNYRGLRENWALPKVLLVMTS